MKLNSLLPTTLFVFALSFAGPALAAQPKNDGRSAEKKAVPTESEIIGKARANYPLKTCLVSDEPLGSMGDAVAYVHRADGKPERVIFICCEGCIDDFKASPAKFLKKVDDAAAKKTGGAKKS